MLWGHPEETESKREEDLERSLCGELTDHTEAALTVGADQGVDFKDLLDQACPVFAKLLRTDHGLQHGGDGVWQLLFTQPAPGGVGVSAVVTNTLLVAVGDVGAHGGQPFESRVGFLFVAVLGLVSVGWRGSI